MTALELMFYYAISVMDYDIPKTEDACRAKLKELFLKNKNVSDIRVIDMLVIKVIFLVVFLFGQRPFTSVCIT